MAKSISTIELEIGIEYIDSDVQFFIQSLPFIGLQETARHWLVFWELDKWDQHKGDIKEYFTKRNIPYLHTVLEGENWNANWENSFEPVYIDSFCQIRAQFHSPKDHITHDIIIDPKMAFGTGHHDTTFQMVKAMQSIISKNDRVIDLGTGTGVLAILAEKMGTDNIVAIDHESAAVENALENLELNDCHRIDVRSADVTTMDYNLDDFDVILANINRNVLLQIEKELSSHAKKGARLILSGVLAVDAPLILDSYGTSWDINIFSQAGDWVCIYGEKL